MPSILGKDKKIRVRGYANEAFNEYLCQLKGQHLL